jgi:hypothetical protein
MPCTLYTLLLVQFFSSELQQCHMSGTFYSNCDLTLVFSTGAGLPARADFPFPIDETGKELCISIKDF